MGCDTWGGGKVGGAGGGKLLLVFCHGVRFGFTVW